VDSSEQEKTILKKTKDYIYKSYNNALNFLFRIFSLFKKKKDFSDIAQTQAEFDKKLVYSLSKSRIPNLAQFKYIKKYLTKKESWAIRLSTFIILVCLVFLGARFYINHRQIVPAKGGEYVEGLVGVPSYINPLYASVSDTDSDISSLVYSSLFKRDKNGSLVNDLVEDYEVSEDGKIYTIKIRTDVKWHDGKDLNIDDIIFTFSAIKDKNFKSPLRSSFLGVEIEKIDENTIHFLLSESYAAFLDLLTFGILPREIWQQIQPESANLAELNMKPIGSGPYKFKQFVKDKSGSIKEYDLVVNDDYYGEKPYLDIGFMFFPSFEEAIVALNNNIINGISYLPREYKDQILSPLKYNYHKLFLPQITAIFLNQEKNIFLKEKSIRQALAYLINKKEIIETYLEEEAHIIDGPILPTSFAFKNDIKKYDTDFEKADSLLNEADWKLVEITEDQINEAKDKIKNENGEATEEEVKEAQKLVDIGAGSWRKKNKDYLIINLTAVEKGENESIAKAIKASWEKAGIKVNINLFSSADIQTEVIKTKNFEALIYGQIVGADPDPYVFWHSSQIGENGLNISNYVNKEVDKLLEDARVIINKEERREKYDKFQEIIAEDVPAVFLYSSIYTYLQIKDIKGFDANYILFPHDRFSNISEWYIKTEKKLVW